MSIRIETITSKTASDYKYSKNMTIGTKESGVDIGKDQEGGSGPATSIIDDTTASTETTYSSSKIEELIESVPSGACYFDTSNVIVPTTTLNSGSRTLTEFQYTATKNCYFVITNGKDVQDTCSIMVDGKTVWSIGSGFSINEFIQPIILKEGSTIKITGLGSYCSYRVYGVK